MSNPTQDMSKNQNTKESADKLHRKIKETWSGLSDGDIKLYSGNRDAFFVKLQEKQSVSKQDAQKRLQQLEKECGCEATKVA